MRPNWKRIDNIQQFIFISFLFSFSLACLASKAHAQSPGEKDPLKLLSQIRQSRPDSSRAKGLLAIGKFYLDKPGIEKYNLDNALIFFDKSIKLCDSLHIADLKNQALQLKGDVCMKAHNYDLGKRLYIQVIDYYKKLGNKLRQAELWKSFGDHLVEDNDQNWVFAGECYKNAQELYKGLNLKLKAIECFKGVADAHMNEGKFKQAESELLLVIDELKEIHYRKLHYTYDLLSSVARLQGDFKKQLYYRLEVVKSIEATGDMTFASIFYFSLGITYYDLNRYEKADTYFRKSLAANTSHDGNYYNTTSFLVKSLIAQHRTNDALMLLKNTVRKVPPAAITDKIYLNQSFGLCYIDLKQLTTAEGYYADFIKLTDSAFKSHLLATQGFVINNVLASDLMISRGQFKKAEVLLNKISYLPANVVSPVIKSKIELTRYRIDSAFKNYRSANIHYKTYTKLKDSIYNITKTRQIDEIQYRFETEKKDRDLELQNRNIQLLKKESRLQQTQVEQSNVIRNLIIICTTILLTLLVILFRRYRSKQRANLQLENKQQEISEKNVQLERLLKDNEWLLREIHHRVKNNLQTSISLLNLQSAQISNKEALSAIKNSQRRMNAMALIHQRLYQSKNMALIGMQQYIRELSNYLVESFGSPKNIKTELHIMALDLDVAVAVPIGLIINEAICNAFKYAFPKGRAGTIKIILEKKSDDRISLFIEDDGTGFSEEELSLKQASLGMKLMKGLTDQIQGEFCLESVDGTIITIDFNDHLIAI